MIVRNLFEEKKEKNDKKLCETNSQHTSTLKTIQIEKYATKNKQKKRKFNYCKKRQHIKKESKRKPCNQCKKIAKM